jgi:hypothetical protein
MSNPTSNFNWQMPTATDLVTDLPADFEVFGQAVDTSLADLKGGTSGQVLSKNTNADMDFVWVTSDDANAIQNTIVDAKGDLIGATAADTPARLAVGTNGQVLTADSTAGTGLAWATPTTGSAQVAGKNAVINGDFLINQRAFTSNTTTLAYNFDRWMQQNAGGSFTVTPQTFTPGAAPIATYEGRTFVQGITATQSAAGDFAIITQRIEDVTRYAGTTVTISFFAKANTGTPKIGVEVKQNFGSGGSPSATVSVPAGASTLTTSFARYSVSVAIPSISGKTLGTTANTSYLELNLWTSAGATYATPASSIGIQNFTASIWGVQLEYAASATYFTTATGTLAGELAACQRYYFEDAKTTISNGYATNTYLNFDRYFHPVAMRTTPTITQTGAVSFSSNTSATTFTIDANGSNALATNMYFQTGASNGLTYLYRPVQFSAEL